MSFTSEVKDYLKTRLRPTSTNVTQPDGTKWVESRSNDQCGYAVCRSPDKAHSPGYVIDLEPDLQIGWILQNLLLGSVDVAYDHSLLTEHRVTHILNVASECSSSSGPGDAIKDNICYKHVSIMDLPETDIVSYFDECFAFIDSALNTGGRILVHCIAGVSRSASIVIGYLMKVNEIDFDKAFNHVKDRRPAIRPNVGFRQQLRNYGCHLNNS